MERERERGKNTERERDSAKVREEGAGCLKDGKSCIFTAAGISERIKIIKHNRAGESREVHARHSQFQSARHRVQF